MSNDSLHQHRVGRAEENIGGMKDQGDSRDSKYLSQFLAMYDPDGSERRKRSIYEELVDNNVRAVRSRVSASLGTDSNPWPWRNHRTAEQWLKFYRDNENLIDKKAEKAQKRWAAEAAGEEAGPSQPRLASKPPSSPRKGKATSRTAFDQDDDYNLVQFLAIECPQPKGRKSVNTYSRLVLDVDNRWPWASRHPAEAWRERYKKRADSLFDKWIIQYQKKLGIDPEGGPRPDLWDRVEQQDYTKGKRKKASTTAPKSSSSPAKPAKQPLKPTSSQNRPPPVPRKKRPIVYENDTEAEAEEPVQPRIRRGKGKRRAISPEEEEESEHEGKDTGLPVVREEEEPLKEPQVAEKEPVSVPAQSSQPMMPEDEDEEMADTDEEVDQLEPSPLPEPQNEVKQERQELQIPSAELIREFNELQESRAKLENKYISRQGSETQDAQEAEDLLAPPETQVADEMEDSELVEQEIDQLASGDEQLDDPQSFASPRDAKKAAQTSPGIAVQEPTPPTSDDIASPSQAEALLSAQISAAALPLESTTTYTHRMTTVLRKRTRDDFFEDLESEAQTSTPPRPVKRRALHVIEEGKFGTTTLREINKPGTVFRNGRRRSGVDELPSAAAVQAASKVKEPEKGSEQWPPKWEKRKGKEPVSGPRTSASPVKTGESSKALTLAAQEVTKEGEGEEEEEFYPFFEPSPEREAAGQDVAREAPAASTDDGFDKEELFAPSPVKRASYRNMPPPSPPQAGPSMTTSKSPAKTLFRPQFSTKGKEPAHESTLPVPNPSPVRRHTFHNNTLASTSHGSHSSRHNVRPRYSLPTTHTASPLPEVAIDGVVITPEDHRLVLEAGVETIMRQLAANTGFGPDVVRTAWRLTRRFSLAEEWLRRMCVVLAENADDVTREVVGESGGEDHVDQPREQDDAPMESEVYYPPEHSRAWLLEQSRVEEGMQNHDEEQEQIPPAPAGPEPRASRALNSRANRAQMIRDKTRRRGS